MMLENSPAAYIAIETEAQVRHHLCAVYRLLAHFGMDDLIYTHVSARIPGEAAFLLNPFGLLFDEVTPSSLVKVDFTGRVLDGGAHGFNPAGFVIHAGILGRRPDLACVVHTHTRAGVALSCLDAGLLPINQFAAEFFGLVGTHEYEGVACDMDEGERLCRDLKGRHSLILRNHGLLTVGESIPAAFYLTYYLEQAARVQMDVLASGRPFSPLTDSVLATTTEQFTSRTTPRLAGHRMWPGLLRRLDRISPGWSNARTH